MVGRREGKPERRMLRTRHGRMRSEEASLFRVMTGHASGLFQRLPGSDEKLLGVGRLMAGNAGPNEERRTAGRGSQRPRLVALRASQAAVSACQREGVGMAEERNGRKRLLLAVARLAVGTERALMHVLVAPGAGLIQAQESLVAFGQVFGLGLTMTLFAIERGVFPG